MAHHIFFYGEGRSLGNATCEASLDDTVQFARDELAPRGADFFYIINEAGTDVWHERDTATKASQLLEEAADCGDQAKRAKRLAGAFRNDQDRDRLLQYAEELDQEAAILEERAVSP